MLREHYLVDAAWTATTEASCTVHTTGPCRRSRPRTLVREAGHVRARSSVEEPRWRTLIPTNTWQHVTLGEST